jgi:RNA 2',3'-cyclic 3'-phosphodiesterase
MPRLFVGLEIPDEIGDRIALLRGGIPGARWIDVENYHVTLRFIGDIDEVTADDIADCLLRIRRRSFSVSITGLGVFGGRQPHSVYAAVTPNPALMELQAELERMLQRLGLEPEGRKFTPHVTIARTKGAQGRDVAQWLNLRGGFSAGPFIVDRFVLFSSKASVGGGPYLVEEAYGLAI